jgi:hypothetical protein
MAWRRGQAYSQDLRDRILAVEGSARAVARQFLVSVSYFIKVRQRRDRRREATSGPQHSRTPRKLAALHVAIAAYSSGHADATIEEFLAPTQAIGDIVIADNLASHKVAGVREAIEARGASLWFLPP